MKRLLSLTTIALVCIITSSCGVDHCLGEGVTGTWIWKESISGWGTRTPENTGDQRILQINFDTYCEFVNDTLVREAKYEIITADDRFYNSPQTMQLADGGVFILTYSARELILDTSYNDDVPTHYYERP